MATSDGQPVSPARQCFLQRLAALNIKLAAREYYVRWAEDWTKARGHQSAARTQAFSTPLADPPTFTIGNSGGSVGVPPAVRGILPHTLLRMPRQKYLLAHQVLTIPWATTFDWQGLADQAWALEPDHRTLGRETIQVRAALPPPPDPSVPLPDTDAEIARITDALRRAIRLAGLAYATEQTYVYWNTRFTRFCLECLKQTPQDAGPAAITAYLTYLAPLTTFPTPLKTRPSMPWSS